MFSRSSFFAVVAAVMCGAAVAFSPATASATVLSDCGNIDLSSGETCTLETSGGCTADCDPSKFQLQCSADLEASCSGSCNVTIDASCTSTCESSCTGGCTTGSFSCEGSCDADCNGHCSSDCASDSNTTECMASCKETCDANCSGSCSGTPPSCTPVTCQAACSGSCQAQANLDCQVTCQESGSASCESNYMDVCTGQCSAPQGALFCNGQFVNVDAAQIAACEQQLTSLLNINVVVSGSAACTGNNCSAQASASCGQIAPGAPVTGSVFAVGLGLGIAGAVRRRVRRSKKA
jgi:hypothetical protein